MRWCGRDHHNFFELSSRRSSCSTFSGRYQYVQINQNKRKAWSCSSCEHCCMQRHTLFIRFPTVASLLGSTQSSDQLRYPLWMPFFVPNHTQQQPWPVVSRLRLLIWWHRNVTIESARPKGGNRQKIPRFQEKFCLSALWAMYQGTSYCTRIHLQSHISFDGWTIGPC